MRILHLTTDEKFIDGAMFTFNMAFPGQNKLLVLKTPANPPIRYIRKSKIDHQVVTDKGALSKIIDKVLSYDWVVVHGMNVTWANLILSIPEKKILFIVWGAEFYGDRFLDPHSLLGPITKNIASALDKSSLVDRLKLVYRKYRYGRSEPVDLDLYERAFKALNYVGLAYKDEFDSYVSRGILREDTKYVKIGYYPMEYFMEGIDPEIELGDGVLIGNSSSFTNNHLEVFEKLKEIGFKGRVLAPLSYGNSRLKNYLVEEGKRTFGDQFEPLTDFIPLKNYTEKISSCSAMIMNHYRQQGMGNIITAAFMGVKVFLNERSTFYRYLRELGCHVYELDSDLKSVEDLKPLNKPQIEKNRSLLLDDISLDCFVESLKTELA